uniref:Ig-like domain-containing protein n=1 Tax=Lepisosteus oculatus TaxID=7918 RepID=W5MZG1_LEPOC
MGCQRIVLIWCLLCGTSQAYSEKRCTVLGNREELKLWKPEEKPKDIKDITWRNSTHTLGRIKNGLKSGLLNISEDGTLELGILQNIAINNYSAKVFNTQGQLIHEAVISLQVIKPIPKPSLAFMCKPKLTIHCDFTHAPESAIYWERNGKRIDDTRATFKNDNKTLVLNAQYEPTDRFACIVQYCGTKVKNESSVPCTAEVNRRNKILGLEFWYFVAAIAGGGVLLIILVSVLLVYQCQKKRKQRQCQGKKGKLDLQAKASHPFHMLSRVAIFPSPSDD